MSETFGIRLKRFALSVDIVDEKIFQRTWDLVKQYLTVQLKPTYTALLIESPVDNKPGLHALDSTEGRHMAFSLKNEKGEPNGLVAYSFCKGKPLWLVSPDKEPIDPDTSIKDKWSKAKNLPRFDKQRDADIRSVVFVPLRQRRRTIGVLDIQSPQYNEITKKITDELILIADTLTVLLALLDINKSQRRHTLEAIDLHSKALTEESWPPLTKPKIFVASSANADVKVMGAIRSVLNEFSNQLDVYYWRESPAGGNINLEILQQVKESLFGLCYFSEPVDDPNSKYKYQDNINVVFEAGMFQSQTNPNVTDDPTGWIPIREKSSPSPPFDFAQQRMIIIQRLAKGDPNIDKLKGGLKDRIKALLGK
ncbi:MAG: TIR domain-containing protein [Planctomycetota bacterium]|jgi:hypothetical protein